MTAGGQPEASSSAYVCRAWGRPWRDSLCETLMARYQINNPFIDYECNRAQINKAPIETRVNETYGQCNEDLIVEALLHAHCWRKKIAMSEIRYVEIGGNHPFQTSCTYLFYRLYGAKGVLCEANPHLAKILQAHRPQDIVVNVAVSAARDESIKFYIARAHELSSIDRNHIRKFEFGFGQQATVAEEIEVENLHINDFLNLHAGQDIDYLSIDTEGVDYAILEAMDMERFRPALLQLEHNSQAQIFIDLLTPRDYLCLGMTDVNLILADRRALAA